MSRLAALVATCSVLALAPACTTAPPLTRPDLAVDTPAHWSATNAAHVAPDGAAAPTVDVTATWWQDFADPGLAATVEEALARNTDLLAAAARVAQAEAGARIAGAELRPSATASLSGSRSKRNFVGFPIPGANGGVLSTISSNYGVSFDVSWELDLWDRLGSQAREGLATWQASRADLAGVRLSVAGQTAKAWFAAAEAGQQVELAEQTVASLVRSSEQVRDRFESGLRPSLDLRLSLSQVAGAEAALVARRRQLDAVSRQLEVLIGRYPGRQWRAPDGLLPPPASVPGGLPADLVSRRPDLAAAERRLVAADQRLRVARASLYPRISLTSSAGTSSNQLGDLIDGDFSVWGLIGNIVAPLFQGGRLRAGVDLAQAGVNELMLRYVGLALRAYAEVEVALAADALLAEQIGRLQDAAEQARAAQDLAEQRYGAGLADYITVLESQRRTFEAQSALLSGRREQLDNRVDLYLALGGGFEAAGLAAQPTDPPSAPTQESSR